MTISNILRQVFPNYSLARHPICKDSALAKIKEKRAEMKATANARSLEVEQ